MRNIVAVIAVMALSSSMAVIAGDQEAEYVSWTFATSEEIFRQEHLVFDQEALPPRTEVVVRDDGQAEIEPGELGW